MYLGMYMYEHFTITKKSSVSVLDPSFKAFKFLIDRYVKALKPHVGFSVLHNGHCGVCGRVLTNPESLETGVGPICGTRKN